jgi:hypothetical protein
MTKRTCVLCAAFIAALALPAAAEPKGGPGQGGPGTERRDLPGRPADHGKPGDKADRGDKGDHGDKADRDDRRGKDARDARDGGGDAARHERGHRAMERLKRSRDERRGEDQDQIQKKWGGEQVRTPAIRNELRVHAWRLARLTRVQSLAEMDNKADVVDRVDGLLAKENARHERRMAELGAKAKDGGPGAAASAKAPKATALPPSKGGAK